MLMLKKKTFLLIEKNAITTATSTLFTTNF